MKVRVSIKDTLGKKNFKKLTDEVQKECFDINRKNAMRIIYVSIIALRKRGYGLKRIHRFVDDVTEVLNEYGINSLDNLNDTDGNVADYKIKRELIEVGYIKENEPLFSWEKNDDI